MDPAGSRTKRRTAYLLGAPFVALALLLPLLPVPAEGAQEEGEIELRLLDQPVWHGPEDELKVKLLVTNDSAETLGGFRIRVGIDDRVTSRSALDSSLDAAPGFEATVVPLDLGTEVEPGTSEVVTLEEPMASFPTLAFATEGGVYPATYTLQDPTTLQDLDHVSSPVIYYPQTPDTPLELVVLIPLNDAPSKGPDGRFVEDDQGSVPLERAAADGGWLDGWLDALEKTAVAAPTEEPEEDGGRRRGRRRQPPPPPPPRPLGLSLAPTPRLLEELADMADGYSSASGAEVGEQSPQAKAAAGIVDRLRSLLGEENVEPVLVPYAFPDVPTLFDRLGLEHALAQLSTAITVVRETTGVNLTEPWFFPPAGRIDELTLQQLQDARYGAKTFFSRSAIPFSEDPLDSGCPESSPSFTCHISVETVSGVTRGFVGDENISQRLANLQTGTDDRVYLQQFFAETSMIHEELPNVSDRVIQVTMPSLWHPTPRLARVLLTGLREAPWLRTLTPDQGLEVGAGERREIVETADGLDNTPDDTYFADVSEADEIVDSYGTMVPPASDRLRRLARNILVAESRMWFRDPVSGDDYALGSQTEALEEMEKVSVAVAEGTTFTSRSGEIQLLLSNNAAYPMKVAVRFDSSGLEFDRGTIIDTYEPGNRPLTVEANATSSGSFLLRVHLETVDGYTISTTEVTISSTSFNEIALGITIGALAFLILFYVVRGVRKRRRPEETDEEADAE